MKIIFMGTPLFGAQVLKALVEKGYEIVLVVTKCDNRKEISEVKKYALSKNLPLFQAKNFKEEYHHIFSFPCDYIITAAFGEFLPEKLLNHPKINALNVHGSLLPKFRGGAPIQRAIINGDQKTGVSIINMTKKMDAGFIYLQEEVLINERDTTSILMDKLSIIGAKLLIKVIENYAHFDNFKKAQDENAVSFAKNLLKSEEELNFNFDACYLNRLVLALREDKNAFFNLENMRFKVYNTVVINDINTGVPGEIIDINKDGLLIKCKDKSALLVTEIIPEGKRKMFVKDYLNGQGKKYFYKGRRIL